MEKIVWLEVHAPEVVKEEDSVLPENFCVVRPKSRTDGKYPTLMVKNKKRLSELKEAGVHCFTISRDETLLVKAMKETLAEMKGDE